MREKQVSTGIGRGIAIPHAKIKGIKKNYAACAVIKEGVNFDSIDNKPVDLLFIIISDSRDSDSQINVLSILAGILNNDELCSEIRNSNNPEEIIKLIKKNEKNAGILQKFL